MRFIGREYELNELKEEYNRGEFALSIIYGRRRVGKTYLIKEFLKDYDDNDNFLFAEVKWKNQKISQA